MDTQNERTDGERAYVLPARTPRRRDVDALVAEARRDPAGRAALVEAARERLQRGLLDDPRVLAETACHLLGSGFLSV